MCGADMRAGALHAAGGARRGRGEVGAPQGLLAVCPAACSHVRTSVRAPTATGPAETGNRPPHAGRGPAPGCVRLRRHGKGVERLIHDRRGADALKCCVGQTGLRVTR